MEVALAGLVTDCLETLVDLISRHRVKLCIDGNAMSHYQDHLLLLEYLSFLDCKVQLVVLYSIEGYYYNQNHLAVSWQK